MEIMQRNEAYTGYKSDSAVSAALANEGDPEMTRKQE